MDALEKNAEMGMELILLWFGNAPFWVQEMKQNDQVVQHRVFLPSKSMLCLDGEFNLARLRGDPLKCKNPVVEVRRSGGCIYLKEYKIEVPSKQLPSRLRATVMSVGHPDPNPMPKIRKFFGKKILPKLK